MWMNARIHAVCTNRDMVRFDGTNERGYKLVNASHRSKSRIYALVLPLLGPDRSWGSHYELLRLKARTPSHTPNPTLHNPPDSVWPQHLHLFRPEPPVRPSYAPRSQGTAIPRQKAVPGNTSVVAPQPHSQRWRRGSTRAPQGESYCTG